MTSNSILDELVFECLERHETEGDAALEALCAAHPDHAPSLRTRIATLRAAGLYGATDAAHPEPFPERLGDFRLLEQLGAGGMGVVYRASQVSLGREVALKLIRPEQIYMPGARERFQREVETIARLAHPGIVPIYTVGEERGIPYFAMELVQGASLAEILAHCAEGDPTRLFGANLLASLPKGSEEEPESALFEGTWNEVCLRIVREVAEALEYAHRRGVLHRDIKPSNVMVTRGGRVLLLDFGLASRSGNDRLTRSGAHLGSLPYLAPEQVRLGSGAVSVQSDVYSLGVTLYEMLALAPAFHDPNTEVLLQKILASRLDPLRKHNSALSKDAETVCHVALEHDPARRYASAGDLARDLTNLLELLPIDARRTGQLVRLARWTQRNPAWAGVGVLSSALVLGLPSALYLQQRGANQEIQAKNTSLEKALVDVRKQSARAENNLNVAMSSVDRMLAQVGTTDLEEVPQFEPVRAKLLEEALKLNEQLVSGQYEDNTQALLALADTRRRAAQIYMLLGRFEDSERALTAAVLEQRLLVERDSESIHAREGLASALDALAHAQRSLGKRDDSALSSAEALRLYAEIPVDGDGGLLVLRKRSELETFHASTLFRLGRVDEAILAHEASVANARELFARDPRSEGEARIASCLCAMGGTCLDAGRDEQCEKVLKEAIEIYERSLQVVEESKNFRENFADALTNLGALRQETKDRASAAPLFERALDIYSKLARDYPNSPRYQDSLNAAHVNLATVVYRVSNDLERAVLLLDDAIASQTKLVEAHPQAFEYRLLLALIYGNLGSMEIDNQHLERASEMLAKGIEQHERLLIEQPKNPVVKARLGNQALGLAQAYIMRGMSKPGADALIVAAENMPADWILHRIIAGRTVEAHQMALVDPALAPTERVRFADELFQRALRLMELSIEAGYRDVKDFENDAQLAPLRASPRFADLRTRLQTLVK